MAFMLPGDTGEEIKKMQDGRHSVPRTGFGLGDGLKAVGMIV
jgi:hypothetical protein